MYGDRRANVVIPRWQPPVPAARTDRMPIAPIVAVTATVREADGIARVRLNQAYVRALEASGLVPMIVSPLVDQAFVPALLRRVDGLVLTGGEDVDPARYDDERHHTVERVSAERDATELALVGAARELRLPTLAICRGMQVVNVALGGTLVQDIASSIAGALPHEQVETRTARTHDVTVDEASRLAAALGASRLAVNSMHHQSVARAGEGLRVTARARDGVIEGMESDDPAWWMLAVQWHPEELTTNGPWDEALFAAFADACRARMEGETARNA